MPDKRPKVRRDYRSQAFAISDWTIEPAARAELAKRGLPDAVLGVIEARVAELVGWERSNPPTVAEAQAGLRALRAPAAALLAELNSVDARSNARLRRRCDALAPSPGGVGRLVEDLADLLSAIEVEESAVHQVRAPHRNLIIARIVRDALRAAALPFTTKPSGPAFRLLRAIIGADSDIRRWIRLAAAEIENLGAR